jgi:CRISPR-associated protein Csb2
VILLLSIRLLGDRFHGLSANGEQPDWPPSSFRVFQAIIAGNAKGESLPPDVSESLRWLESLPPPVIVIPPAHAGKVMLTYVLNNTERRSRVQKFLRPTLLHSDRVIEFAWEYDPSAGRAQAHAKALLDAVRHVRVFGWGIDLAVGHGAIVDRLPKPSGSRRHYFPRESPDAAGIDVRVPRIGSLESLQNCYRQYLARFESDETAVLESAAPLYEPWPYTAGFPRPHTVFKLVDESDDAIAYPHARLIHVAGMVRHAAIGLMSRNPPADLRGLSPQQWVDRYVAGHIPHGDESDGRSHTQLSYVPLPSTGHPHTDPAVRRVMILAPLGDEAWLDHLTERLDGQPLEPLPGTVVPPGTYLQRIPDRRQDGVRDAYTGESLSWASFTPVILPGHDDRKPDKTRKLIVKALAQSGIDQPCEFEWGSFSLFPKSYSAHKYVRDESAREGKRPVGYIRPDHLLHLSAVHLRLRFEDPVPGPIVIGAGRHCGFGLLACADPF